MNIIEVKLWGSLVGRAMLKDDNICVFQYDRDFINKNIQVSPIKMPLSNLPYSFRLSDTFKGLPGMLADSLPDKFGNKVIDSWLIREGRSLESFSTLERLCYIGKRGMGALEYFPLIKDVQNKCEIIEINNLVELCNEVLSNRENVLIKEKDDYVNQLINVGTSAGGARAKAIVAYNKEKGIFKSGQIDAGKGFEYYILKFGSINNNADKEEKDDSYHTRVEYAYYLLAKKVGINISDSLLINNNGYHFMTKRFDRFIENGEMQKLHMQTLAGLGHYDFNDAGSCSYEEVVPLMRRLGLEIKDIEEFYRRMIFNVVYKNQDDHVKNISFLMDKNGNWKLSPAYDMTFAYNPNGIWTNQHQMTICGKRKDLSMDDLLTSGKNMGLSLHKCKSIVDDILSCKNEWNALTQQAELPKEISNKIYNDFENII